MTSWLALVLSATMLNLPIFGLFSLIGLPVALGLLMGWIFSLPPGPGFQASVAAKRGSAALCVAASLAAVTSAVVVGLAVSNFVLLVVQRHWEGYPGFPFAEVLGSWVLAQVLVLAALRFRTGHALRGRRLQFSALALQPLAVAGLLFSSGLPLSA